MEVIVAKSAGFCFGVRRAVDRVYELTQTYGERPIYTYGPIIHNDEVVEDLQKKGVRVVNNVEEFSLLPKGVVVIRSHGVSRSEEATIRSLGHEVEDMTCPFVKKIHRIADEKSSDGSVIIIAGDEKHPEVKGIVGWCNGKSYVIKDAEDAEKIEISDKKRAVLVAQTTFNYIKFKKLIDAFSKKSYNINCVNTICNATRERQEEAARIASSVDGMLVVGGSHSSNTQKLYEICKRECENTHYIQTAEDLKDQWFLTAEKVGVTGGASTPNKIIEEVLNNVR